jgi:hypothetical protein
MGLDVGVAQMVASVLPPTKKLYRDSYVGILMSVECPRTAELPQRPWLSALWPRPITHGLWVFLSHSHVSGHCVNYALGNSESKLT